MLLDPPLPVTPSGILPSPSSVTYFIDDPKTQIVDLKHS